MTGILSRLTTETATLRGRLETLTRQSTSGIRTDQYGDLEPEVPRALSLRAEVDRREAYGRAMDQTSGRTAVMQSALGRLTLIAREFGTQVTRSMNSRDPDALVTVPARARAALQEVAQLLNTRQAGEYLFSGSDIANPPISDPDMLTTGPLATAIAGDVATLTPGNATSVLAAIQTKAADTSAALSPFSAFLEGAGASEAARSVPASDGEQVAYGIFANRNSASVPVASPGAGGWARDLIGNLMALAALTPAQRAQGNGFDDLVAGLSSGFRSAESALAEESGILGLTEQRLETMNTRHKTITIALKSQLADIQEVDIAETLTRLQSTRTTLEASYRAIGSLSDLTLANFLR
jgi:flagellin-like hook-associated protein FlgL